MVQRPSSTTVQDGICNPVSQPISGFSLPLLTSDALVEGATGPRAPGEVSDAETSTSSASGIASARADTKESGAVMTSVATSEGAVATANIKMEEGVHGAEAGADTLAEGASEDEDDEKGPGGGKSGKSRRELPAGAVATLKAWLLSPEHFTHPYPTPQDQVMLMQKTGIDKKQLKNWFTNARRRIWKPMLKKQLEQGKLAATGAGGGGVVAMPGGIPGLIVTTPGAIPGALPTAVAAPATGDFAAAPNAAAPSNVESSMQTMQVHYQQALQQQQQQQQQPTQQPQQGYEIYAYAQQGQGQQGQQIGAAGPQVQALPPGTYFIAQPQYGQQQQQQSQPVQPGSGDGTAAAVATSGSPLVGQTDSNDASAPASAPAHNMIKADSHAVLMELFARDQDLVRQATEGARAKAAAAAATPGTANTGTSAPSDPPPDSQKPDSGATNQSEATNPEQQSQPQGPANGAAFAPVDGAKGSVAPLTTWPHFSSLSSLNNINNLKGVKSIANMSSADLASKGNVNNKGNLANVKSVESMGRHDSYAFLEVFFDDRFGAQPQQQQQQQRGVKREREEDNDVGLSLDADEAPSTSSLMKPPPTLSSSPGALPVSADPSKDNGTDNGGKVEHAFDDALAARGLLSVSRSSEKLTDLALPAKMQRTLSQELLRSSGSSGLFPSFCFPSASSFQPVPLLQESKPPPPAPQQPLPHPGNDQKAPTPAPLADPSASGSSVTVPATTTCALCHCVNVDTQLRPCGHMFHGKCLKPSMQTSAGPPQCPIDHIPMQSAVLAIPAKESK